MSSTSAAPRWTTPVLYLAAAADVLGGALLALSPATPLAWAGQGLAGPGEVWRCLGILIVGYGLGFALAARRPFQRWPLVAVGLLAKVGVPLGFLLAAFDGRMTWELGPLVLAYGPIWWVPFGLILRGSARAHRRENTPPLLPLDMALSLYRDREGSDLLEASRARPQFLVFLRHFGCTFCREALADLAAIQERLSAVGARLVLVHMASEAEADDLFGRYGLRDVTAISDPDRVLYRAFALRRGSPSQLVGWSVWKRGWDAGVKQGHGIGWLRGDAAQMPGAFVVSHGQVVAQFIHESAADRPDYVVLAEAGVEDACFQGDLEGDGLGRGFKERLRRVLASEATGQA